MIKVDTNCLASQASNMQTIANELNRIASRVDAVNRTLRWNTSVDYLVRMSLNANNKAVSTLDEKTRALSNTLNHVASTYAEVERANKFNALMSVLGPIADVLGDITNTDNDGWNIGGLVSNAKEWFEEFAKENVGAIVGSTASLAAIVSIIGIQTFVEKGAGILVDALGIPTKSVDRTWFGYELDGENPGVTAWIGKVGDRAETDNGYAEVNAYLGKVEAKTKADGGFMKTRVKSEIKNGKEVESESYEFVYAEAGLGGTINVLSADSEMGVGDDMLGAEVGSEINVGNASAKGEGEFSIGEDGVNANLGGELMVSALEAEVEGTINILGIEITAKVGGHAGAAGVKGKVGIEDNKFVCEGDVAALLGVSGGVEIGFNEEGWDNFVDFVTFWD